MIMIVPIFSLLSSFTSSLSLHNNPSFLWRLWIRWLIQCSTLKNNSLSLQHVFELLSLNIVEVFEDGHNIMCSSDCKIVDNTREESELIDPSDGALHNINYYFDFKL